MADNLWTKFTALFVKADGPTDGPRPDAPPGGPTGTRSVDVYNGVAEKMKLEGSRLGHYGDYDQMNSEAPEAHRALDAFCDTATQPTSQQTEILDWTYGSDAVKAVILSLRRRTGIADRRVWGTMRRTKMYGDHFAELVFDSNGILRSVKPLPVRSIRIAILPNGDVDPEYPYRQHSSYGKGAEVARFRRWQIVHWGEVPEGGLYGYRRSLLSAARRPWKALEMSLNAIVAERILRTGTRLAFPVDVTGLTTDEAVTYLKAVKREYKRRSSHNTTTGKRGSRLSPMTPLDDIWVPWTKDGPAKPAEVLNFGTAMGEVGDVKMIHARFLAALDTPLYLLGYEEALRSRAATGFVDAGYIRSVVRGQQAYLDGLVDLVNRALWASGFDKALEGDWTELWSAKFPPLQLVDEKLRWEIEELKSKVAKTYAVDLGSLSNEFVLTHFLGLTPEEAVAAAPTVSRSVSVEAMRAAVSSLPEDMTKRLSVALGEEEAARMLRDVAILVGLKIDPATTDKSTPREGALPEF